MKTSNNNNKNKTSTEKKPKKLKIVTKPIRKKDNREALRGFECKCCTPFYNALGLTDKQRKQLVQTCSRHRFKHTPPTTPTGFWNANF